MSEFLRNLNELTREAVFEESARDTDTVTETSYNGNVGGCNDSGNKNENWQSLFYDPLAANNVTEDHRSRSHPCNILTSLLHAECEYDCAYCRVCKRKKPASVTPKEMADYFTKNWRGAIRRDFLKLRHQRRCRRDNGGDNRDRRAYPKCGVQRLYAPEDPPGR